MVILGERKATIFDIQKFSVHDGPGIRTTVFFKGCPLKCKWCFSPESQKKHPEVSVSSKSCIGSEKCGECLTVCPLAKESALQVKEGIVQGIDRSKCSNCLECARACPNNTLKTFGKKYTVRELLQIVTKDSAFYGDGCGAVTCTGGDPLLQYGFIKEFFQECRRYRIHTCLESEMYCSREVLEGVFPYVNLWITDIKAIDSNEHKRLTGTSNERILDNIKFLVDKGADIIIRTPVVPLNNDSERNIRGIAQFVSEELDNRIAQYQLLPYRTLGADKYESLGMVNELKNLELPDDQIYFSELHRLAEVMQEYGVPAVAGSNTKL